MKPRKPIHPGEMLLQEFLRPMGVSQRQFAVRLGWTTAKLNELVKGRRGVTADSGLAWWQHASESRSLTGSDPCDTRVSGFSAFVVDWRSGPRDAGHGGGTILTDHAH